MRRLLLPLVALAAACAVNPVTGERQLSLIPESQEIALGKQGAADVLRSMGEVKSPALQQLVAEMGRNMALKAERPRLPWKFHVIDDAAVNAFAMPGGFIFVTRGLLAHMGSEAELAAVVGHEIGHVTAKHSVVQMSQQQLAQVGLGLTALISPALAQYGQLASAGMNLMFLKFGRDDESQADELGFRYMLDGGWDVRAMPRVFDTLDRVGEAAGPGLPEWLSTHPNPANREEVARRRVSLVKDVATLKLAREPYLKMLEGLPYGENPRKGYVRGSSFIHPELALRIDFPAGWKVQNTPEAVVAQSANGDAAIQLVLASQDTPEAAMRAFVGREGLAAQPFQGTKVRDWPAAETTFTATGQQGGVQGRVAFVRAGTATVGVIGLASPVQFQAADPLFKASLASLAPVTDAAALAVEPAKISVVALDAPMTLDQFQQKFPSTIPLAQLAVMNGVQATETLPAGTLVKRVSGGTIPR